MSEHSHEAVQKHIKLYLVIGAVLLMATAVTVYAASIKFDIIIGIAIAILIATIKGSLVAGYFMHLFNERKLIYQLLILTGIFIVIMFGLFLFAYGDEQGKHSGIYDVPARHAHPHHAETTEAAHVP